MAQFSWLALFAKRKWYASLLCALSVCGALVHAQTPSIVYSTQVYGRGNADSQPSGGDANLGKNSTALDAAGNIYVTGSTSNGLNLDFLTVKYSPAGAILWRAVTNGVANGNDVAKAIAVDSSGNVLVTGSSDSNGYTDYLTVKYDGTNGDELWRATFDGAAHGDDDAYAIAVDAAGNAVVTGSSFVSSARTNYDYVTVKYDAAGVEQWRMSLDGSNSTDHAAALCLDINGNAVVTGYSFNYNNFNYDYVTVKYPAVGFTNTPDELWKKSLSVGTNNDLALAMACDASDNVHITGQSITVANNTSQFLSVKYGANGITAWSPPVSTLATPANVTRSAYAIAVDPTGNVVVNGSEQNRNNNISESNPLQLTVKYNSSGVEQWRATRNTSGTGGAEIFTALVTDAAGNIYASGFAINPANNNNELVVVKYSAGGGVVWQSFITGAGSANSAALMALRVDVGGNVIATGFRHNGFENDFLVAKFNSAGVLQWAATEGENSKLTSALAANADNRKALVIDSTGNVFVAGQSGQGAGSDFITAKIDTGGNTLWRTVLNGASGGIDRAYAIAFDGGGNVYASGDSFAGGFSDFMTVKYDANGIEQWRRQPGHVASTFNSVGAIVADPAGGVIVTGHASNGADFLTVKYAADGTEVWRRTVNGSANSVDTPVAMAIDAFGNILVAGKSFDGNYDGYLTVKYSQSDNSTGGQPTWRASLPGNGSSPRQPFAIASDASGSVFVTGDTTVKYDANLNELWRTNDTFRAYVIGLATDGSVIVGGTGGRIVKYDANGNQVWSRAINGAIDAADSVYALVVDIDGSIYATSRNSDDLSGNYLTVKLGTDGFERWRVITNTDGGGVNGVPAMALDASRKLILAGNGVSGILPAAILVTKISQAPGAPTGVTAVAGNSVALISFTPPPATASPVIGYAVTCQPGSVLATGTASPILVNGLVNNQAYACSVTATNAYGAGAASLPANVTPTATPVLALFAVKSQKTHGVAGDFSLNVIFPPVMGVPVTVEPRAIGAGHKVVFQFNDTVASIGTVNATAANSMPVGNVTATYAGNDVVVRLTGVPDNQRVLISFLATGASGSANASASVGYLMGDVTNSGLVTAADISAVKSHVGQAVNASNFRFDIDASGSVGAADLSATKARSGLVLP